MTSFELLSFAGPTPELSFRVRLLRDKNRAVVENLLALLPLRSFLLHVVVAGETIYLPAPTFSLSANPNMIERRKGTVYYNTTSQSICICYGAVTESTLVNEFAQVIEEDLPKLVNLGKIVYEQTINRHVPRIVQITISRNAGQAENKETMPHNSSAPEVSANGNNYGSKQHWRTAKALLEHEASILRLPSEPADIQAIRLGVVKSRAAGEASPLQATIFLQGFLSTLGPHVLARLLTASEDSAMTLDLMVRQTRVFLTATFNHFAFLADMGLERLGWLGAVYARSLESLTTLDEYRQLTDALRTVIQLMYRWLHLVFPWYLKDQFKARTPEEAAGMPKLELYTGEEDDNEQVST